MLPLGTTRGKRTISLTDEERSRHVHLIGGSGTGKSKLLESMVRRDILHKRGLCLIDPHGTLAKNIVGWCAERHLNQYRRIHVLDLSDIEWCMGYNPLALWQGQPIEPRVDAMVAACAEVWGGEDLDQTPLLATCLQLLFYALATNRLTLAEALSFSETKTGLWKTLTAGLNNTAYASSWRELSTLSARDFEERFSSTRRRLLRFLAAPALRRMLGQTERALDLKSIMDEGDTLIVNLAGSGAASSENARLIGTLLLSDLRLCAMARAPMLAKTRPFTVYVDECYDYLTSDIERILDETRKFGLHAVLSHQRLGQLKARSESIYNGVMAGAQTKIVFGGLTDDDAQVLALEVMRSSFNLERPKHVLDKPIVTDEVPYWLESESATEGQSSSEAWGSSSASGSSASSFVGIGATYDDLGETVRGLSASEGESSGTNEISGSSYMSSSGYSTSDTRGRSQTLKPIRTVLPTAVYSLEEELHLATVKLRELPNQAAIVKRRGHPPVRFRPVTMKPAIEVRKLRDAFVEESHARSPYVLRADDADAAIAARDVGLRGTQSEPVPDTAFWSE